MNPPIRIEERWQRVPGHLAGLTGPLIVGVLRWPDRFEQDLAGLLAFLDDALPGVRTRLGGALSEGLTPNAFLDIVREVSVIHRVPVLQSGKVLDSRADSQGGARLTVAFPAVAPRHTILVARWLANAIDAAQRAARTPAAPVRNESARNLLESLRQQVPTVFSGSVNHLRIVRAAEELGWSYRWLSDGQLLVGSGRYGRLFRSTITETTSALGVALARSKSQTATLLTMAGLPSVRHHRVDSIETALEHARALGYPVVLKPEDLDGGMGVYAGIQDEEQLRRHFDAAFQVSRNLLVEKHVDGQDYRLTVDDGRVVKAILRRPGGITGDGRKTVARLVDEVRADAPAARRGDSLLSLDEEALQMLARHGMGPDSVPEAGRFIALRMRANMSTGGTSHDAMGKLHPDNVQLAIRAARTLRLDVAGIDLLIPDISVSWLVSGAAICEVNAQPQISTEFAPEVLRDLIRRLVPAPGDLRTVVVVDFGDGTLDPGRCTAAIAAALRQQGERVFWSNPEGLHLDSERIGFPNEDVHASATVALLDRQASAAVIAMPASLLLARGLPWARVDRICVVGTQLASAADRSLLLRCARLSRDHVRGPLLVEPALRPKARALLDGTVDVATFTLHDGQATQEWLGGPRSP